MNERGFFTIVGLCLLLVAAIFIKGVNEFEANYAHGITNFQLEHHLQNVADRYLMDLMDAMENYAIDANELKITKKLGDIAFGEFKLKNVTVEIHAKHTNIKVQNSKDTDLPNLPKNFKGDVILSVASCDNPLIEGKMYRRALGYIVVGDPATENDKSETVYFINH